MKEEERWINLEGPEPPGIHELLESVRDVPELTPEEDAALTRSIHAAIAARRRRDRRVRRAAAGSVLVLAAAALPGTTVASDAFPQPSPVATLGTRAPTSTPNPDPPARALDDRPAPNAPASAGPSEPPAPAPPRGRIPKLAPLRSEPAPPGRRMSIRE